MLGRTLFVLLVLAPLSSAQEVLPAGRLHRITGPVRDAGILHVATNTWTRKASAASLGADTIYDNTVSSLYYSALSGDTYIDEGRLPSPTSPTNVTSRPGCATSYTIDGLQISYCTDRVSPAPFHMAFYESYVACSSVIGVTPTAGFLLSGLPGSASGSAQACWTITIDLGAPPGGSGLAFTMAADGDGTYSAPAASNLFGWSFRSTAPWPEQAATGPIFAGEPGISLHYDGTRWDDIVDYAESGTGMGSAYAWRVEGGPTLPNCYWFGSAFASFHLELYADSCPGQSFMTPFCTGGVPNSPCPCGNASPYQQLAGCRNSFGVGGRLRGTGTPSIAGDTLVLSADQLPASATMLFFQGTQRQAAGTVLGDGLRCAGGTVTRLGVKQAASGAALFPEAGDPSIHAQGMVLGADTRTYQVWYRNSASFCTPATFNLTNGWEVRWTL